MARANATLLKYDRDDRQIIDGDFTIATAVSTERIQYPFEGDLVNYFLHQDYIIFTDYYPESVPLVGSPHPLYPNLLFIRDEPQPIQDLGMGVGKFTRIYAVLPYGDSSVLGVHGLTYARKEAESHTWEKPGVSTTGLDYVQYWCDPEQLEDNGTYATLFTYNGLHHNISANWTTATVFYGVTDEAGQYTVRFYTSTIYNRGNDWIQVRSVPYDGAGSFVYMYFTKPIVQIAPTTKVVNSVIYYDYWLEGYNCTSPETIPIIQQWAILDENLNETNIITEHTNPPLFTTTIKGYRQMVTDGDWVCAESSIVGRWNANIFERRTRYVQVI